MKMIPKLSPRDLARFWSRVEESPNGCWRWTSTQIDGYGYIRIQGITHKATRIAWTLYNGPIPAGMNILHHCDNPSCVNPDHLYPGTHKENARDRVIRGRQTALIGTDNPSARLTPEKVIEIRRLHREGDFSNSAIARMFGVSLRAVRAIISGETWKHVA